MEDRDIVELAAVVSLVIATVEELINTLMLMGETGVQLVVEYLQNMHKALDLIAMPHIKWHTDKEQLLK